MQLEQMISRVQSLTRDLNKQTFRRLDIVDFVNEGIDRVRTYIPELVDINYLSDDSPTLYILPERFHYLLPLYAASRCFTQDERYHMAGNMMNEFEVKLDELRNDIINGYVKLYTIDGVRIPLVQEEDYVRRYKDEEDDDLDEFEYIDGGNF